jgi:sporulation protein YlmC with PRC-barrel domain
VRLSRLLAARVTDPQGRELGRVHDVVVEDGVVVQLAFGPRTILHALGFRRPRGSSCTWDQVVEITEDRVVVDRKR